MISQEHFSRTVERIVNEDPRFPPEAYEFISQAVAFTAKKLDRKPFGRERHVSGRELLDGVREYAICEFGPLASEVLRDWGITNGMSIGHIVFNMVDNSLLGKSENDSLDDFSQGFDFEEAFVTPFSEEAVNIPSPPVIV